MGETGKGWEDMSIIQIMVTIIIVTILVTVILGVASYAAYWLRRNRRPARRAAESDEPRFFFRYMPPGEADVAGAAGAAGVAGVAGVESAGEKASVDAGETARTATVSADDPSPSRGS